MFHKTTLRCVIPVVCVTNEREESVVNQHMQHPPKSPTQRVPPERDGNYDKPEFVQPQEETLMSIVWN